MHRLVDYLQRLARLWWLVLLTIAVAGTATGLTDLVVPRSYTAKLQLVLRPAPGLPPERDLTRLVDNVTQAYLVNTLSTAINQASTLEQAATVAGLSAGGAADYTVLLTPHYSIQGVDVEVTGPRADRAAAYANGIAQVAIQSTTRLYRIISLQVPQPATPPAEPSRPSMPRDVPVALGLGLVLGLLLAVFYDYMAR